MVVEGIMVDEEGGACVNGRRAVTRLHVTMTAGPNDKAFGAVLTVCMSFTNMWNLASSHFFISQRISSGELAESYCDNTTGRTGRSCASLLRWHICDDT